MKSDNPPLRLAGILLERLPDDEYSEAMNLIGEIKDRARAEGMAKAKVKILRLIKSYVND